MLPRIYAGLGVFFFVAPTLFTFMTLLRMFPWVEWNNLIGICITFWITGIIIGSVFFYNARIFIEGTTSGDKKE